MKRNRLAIILGPLLALALVPLAGCASAPQARQDQIGLEDAAEAMLDEMIQEDPSVAQLIDQAPGYVVFPAIGEGAFMIGAGNGVGVVYGENHDIMGYAELREVSLGLQAGGQSFAQLVVFENQEAFDRLLTGNFDLTADVSATALTSGSAAQANFEGGTVVLIHEESGLMAQASVAGQQIRFRPAS